MNTDVASTTLEPDPNDSRTSVSRGSVRRKVVARFALTALLFAAGCFGVREVWNRYMYSPWTRDARIAADVVAVAPDVSGFITELHVKDNQMVHKGDVLFVIDQERYKLAEAAAEAGVAARHAAMIMQSRIADRRAKLTSAAVSDEARENAHLNAEAARAAYEGALVDRSTAELNLKRTVIYAPVNGYVTNLTVVAGQFASIGTRVLAIIDSNSYYVKGYFEETKLPFLAVGQPVTVHLMGHDAEIMGHVDSVSRGITDRDNTTGPELLAAVTPTFEWVRLAQRIPVRIHIDNVPAGVVISAGMTCTVIAEHLDM